jgi:RNA polymerase sigma-70 factor (ECF subfamily)
MNEIHDKNLIDRVLNGNISAYSYLVNKYKNMAFTVAIKIVRNREDAEEIAQDAFLKAFRSLKNFKKESNFSTWIYRIVHNTAVSKIRKKQLETVFYESSDLDDFIIEDTETGLNSLETEEQKRFINAALDKLPGDEALIITLYYLNESSVDEISQITGLTRANVKIKLFRARKKIFSELNKMLKNEITTLL